MTMPNMRDAMAAMPITRAPLERKPSLPVPAVTAHIVAKLQTRCSLPSGLYAETSEMDAPAAAIGWKRGQTTVCCALNLDRLLSVIARLGAKDWPKQTDDFSLKRRGETVICPQLHQAPRGNRGLSPITIQKL